MNITTPFEITDRCVPKKMISFDLLSLVPLSAGLIIYAVCWFVLDWQHHLPSTQVTVNSIILGKCNAFGFKLITFRWCTSAHHIRWPFKGPFSTGQVEQHQMVMSVVLASFGCWWPLTSALLLPTPPIDPSITARGSRQFNWSFG